MKPRRALSNTSEKADRPGVRAFFLAMAALTVALVLALYSGAAARTGNLALASTTALAALVVAGWVAVTLVPVLAWLPRGGDSADRRTPDEELSRLWAQDAHQRLQDTQNIAWGTLRAGLPVQPWSGAASPASG